MKMTKVKVYSPGSIGNVGCGFDVIGLAIEAVGDTVEVWPNDLGILRITAIEGDDSITTGADHRECQIPCRHACIPPFAGSRPRDAIVNLFTKNVYNKLHSKTETRTHHKNCGLQPATNRILDQTPSEPSVHRQSDSGYSGSFLRTQEGHRRGNFLRTKKSTDRRLFRP